MRNYCNTICFTDEDCDPVNEVEEYETGLKCAKLTEIVADTIDETKITTLTYCIEYDYCISETISLNGKHFYITCQAINHYHIIFNYLLVFAIIY